ncbi:HlyD family efflux transporter periplasmic adaptor subunit [Leptospira langatensis]|uniref:HlyD family efflux transporter periplasmic adaptor subunit n=1 Tax=Leptospira langatensis TaxID=2484983 RepID=A0A5F2A0B4_9LEPT|nr:efflux RND transporter periplasmic adaptor subunit [Leptospira langatensis]TGK04227.1 HlyD family efflux transporter periplasmic adaptor subunit [Leptospira langatensis]TGL43707.1 HlyD family efflux transporter periplasmic adaptor subunit [Leptospira langatensis]
MKTLIERSKTSKILFLISSLLIFTVLFSCGKAKDIYYCPMHPTYTSDRPGTCPICNMDLVKKEDHADHSSGSDHASHELNPNGSEFDSSPEANSNEDLSLSFEKQQSIGIKTDIAKVRNLTKQFRAYSNVAYDPELYTALTEYKESVRSSAALAEFGSGLNIRNLQLRLQQLGLSQEQIRVWTSGGRDPSELILGGKGGRAHIYSQIYESDLSFAKPGLSVIFKTDAYPDQEFKGKIKSVDTILDKNTRTLRLRSEVSDPSHLLKPQMFGEVLVQIQVPHVLSIPSSAILDTGTRKIVYTQIGPDKFRAIEIETGRIIDPWTEIKSGLKTEERVVTESTFLLDSEAKIRFGSKTHSH